MEIQTILEKLTKIRNRKGYTYENMADELGITPTAYRKIEIGETKLTVERLFKISAILETPVSELLDINKTTLLQNNHNNTNVYQQKIEYFYQENKEITEQLILAKDQLINQLQREIETLKERGSSPLYR